MAESIPNVEAPIERFGERLKKSLGRNALRLTAIIAGAGAILGVGSTIESTTGHEPRAEAAGPNGAEQAWCRWPSRYALCIKAQDLGNEALAEAQNVANDHGLAIHNGGADAFRHCYWSGLMTDEFGWQTAKGFGDRHEYKDDQDPREREMDEYNNRQGRIWAQEVNNIGERCLQGALNGELRGMVPNKW